MASPTMSSTFSFTPAATGRHHVPNHPVHEGEKDPAQPALEDLFNYGRIKTKAPLLHKLLFLAYIPLGLLVLIVRLVLFLAVCLSVMILPRSIGDYINIPVLRFVTGLMVRTNYNGTSLTKPPFIIAANHIADFDTFAMWMVMPKFHTLVAAHLKVIPVIGAVYRKLGAIFVTPTVEGRAEVKAKVHELVKADPDPILIFPEGGLTNGAVGTMMYHRFVFSLDVPIVPLAIALKDPWPVTHDYLGSTWTRNFLWFLFVPFHVFELTYLPAQNRNSEEAPEEFARRVQEMTCDYLNISATKWAYSEKKELWKQISEGKKKIKSA